MLCYHHAAVERVLKIFPERNKTREAILQNVSHCLLEVNFIFTLAGFVSRTIAITLL